MTQIKNRPSFNSIFINLAESLSQRSNCDRLSVGCVIVSTDYTKVLSIGYNGNAAGLPNCCDDKEAKGACGCLHAEENAVIHCDSPRNLDKIVIVTHSPCVMCAKRLINLGGVKKVIYKNDFRSLDGLELLKKANIAVEKF